MGPGKLAQYGRMGHGLGHHRDVGKPGQPLVEPGGDEAEIERRDEVGPNAAIEQGPKRRLGTDDHDIRSDPRIRQLVHVPRQARPGTDTYRRTAGCRVEQIV